MVPNISTATLVINFAARKGSGSAEIALLPTLPATGRIPVFKMPQNLMLPCLRKGDTHRRAGQEKNGALLK